MLYLEAMSTIRLTLEPDKDGTLHLPLPPELQQGMLKVTATIEPVPQAPAPDAKLKGFGCLKGKIHISPDFDEPLEDFKDYMR